MSEQTTTVQTNTESAGAVQQDGADKTVLGSATVADTTKGADKAAGDVAKTGADKQAADKGADTSTTTEAPEQKTAREAAEKANAVPEKYEFKLPDGVTLDQAAFDAYTPKFKELGLTQAQAQGLVDAHLAAISKSATESEAAFAQQEKDWRAQAMADKEIGGAKFDANAALAIKTMSAFGSPELVKLMNTTGFGNHPELIRFFARVGKSISEDTMHRPGEAGAGARSIEERLYGNKAA